MFGKFFENPAIDVRRRHAFIIAWWNTEKFPECADKVAYILKSRQGADIGDIAVCIGQVLGCPFDSYEIEVVVDGYPSVLFKDGA